MRFRSSLVPVVNITSTVSSVFILLGFFTEYVGLIDIGIVLLSVGLLFQLVTLPVEFNASHRALKILNDDHLIDTDEVKNCRKVLTAAALTYVAGVASTVLEMLRLVLMFTRRD